MRSVVVRAMSVMLVAVCGLEFPASAHAGADVATFHGQSPARLLDTRSGAPTVDGGFAGNGVIVGSASATVTVIGRGGVPSSGVGAVALNITVINPSSAGFVTVHPSGVSRPNASNVNFIAAQTVANMVVVSPGSDGQVVVFNGSDGRIDMAIDVLGWFPAGASFTGLTPARVLDTRGGAPTIDGLFGGIGALAAGTELNLPLFGRGGMPLGAVGAVALNVTVTDPGAPGYLTVFPTASTLPATSNINFSARQTVANMVIVPVGADGQVSIFNSSTASTGVIVDVLGWFPTGAEFAGLTPARLMDSRRTSQTADGRFGGGGPIHQAATFNLAVTGRGNVPASNVGAVALNVTVTNPTAAGYLTVFPQGALRPVASNLNFKAGQTIANMVIVPVGNSGQVSIFNSAGDSNIIVDVVGWFANPTIPATHYGTDLVLRPNGIGTAVFGDPAATTIEMLTGALGTPTSDVSKTSVSGTPAYWRYVCFADGPCVTIEGNSAATAVFKGWSASGSGERVLDTNGLGVGSRGSDFPGSITSTGLVFPGPAQCFPALLGTAASGVFLELTFTGATPIAPPPIAPVPSEVIVERMTAGADRATAVCA